MPNGTTPAGLIRRGQRQVQTRGALGMSNISKEAQDVFRMLSGYLTDIKARLLSGGEKATEVETAQKSEGDKWGYGAGLFTFVALSLMGVDPKTAATISGITSAGARKAAEDLTRLDVGVGGIALGEDELPIPPKPKYYQTQYEKLPTARGEAEFNLENLYQMGRQMALPRSLSTGYNVYRGANLLTDLYSGIKDMFADKADGTAQAGAYDNLLQLLDYSDPTKDPTAIDPSLFDYTQKGFGAPSQRWKLPGGPQTWASSIFDYPESSGSGIEEIRRYIRGPSHL